MCVFSVCFLCVCVCMNKIANATEYNETQRLIYEWKGFSLLVDLHEPSSHRANHAKKKSIEHRTRLVIFILSLLEILFAASCFIINATLFMLFHSKNSGMCASVYSSVSLAPYSRRRCMLLSLRICMCGCIGLLHTKQLGKCATSTLIMCIKYCKILRNTLPSLPPLSTATTQARFHERRRIHAQKSE